MADPGFFKTCAIGGFEKKSVLSYIDMLNENFHTREQEYNEKIEAFSKAQDSQLSHIKKLEMQLSEQTAKLEAVAGQIELERAEAHAAQESISSLTSKNAELEKQLGDARRELQIQLERNRQLQFRVESIDYKAKKYDEISTQIGDAMIEARRDAERIIAAAHTQADEITNDAKTKMQAFYEELGGFSSDAVQLRKSVEEILFVLNDRIEVMQDVVSQIKQRMDPSAFAAAEEPAAPDQDTEGGVSDEDL